MSLETRIESGEFTPRSRQPNQSSYTRYTVSMNGETVGRFFRDDFIRFTKKCGVPDTNKHANELVRLGYHVSLMIDKQELDKAQNRFNTERDSAIHAFKRALFEDAGLVIDFNNQGNEALLSKLLEQHPEMSKESMLDIVINFRQITAIVDHIDHARQQTEEEVS